MSKSKDPKKEAMREQKKALSQAEMMKPDNAKGLPAKKRRKSK